MKREFSSCVGIMACAVLLIAFSACGGDDGPTATGTGSISGTISFEGTWPATGNIQVSAWSYWPPNGPPAGFTNPLVMETDYPTYQYKITGLAPGNYVKVVVGWRDPADFNSSVEIGEYGAFVVQNGTDTGGLDIIADLSLAGQ